MLFLVLSSVLLCIVVYRYFDDWRRFGHFPGMSGLSSLPLLGHAYRLDRGRPVLGRMVRMAEEYGPVYRFEDVS